MASLAEAAGWGLLAGSALVIGAGIGWRYRISPRGVAAVMAFGSGVLLSALSFELMDEAFRQGGIEATAIGFLSGAAVYTACNVGLARWGARHRKRSNAPAASATQSHGADAGGSTGLSIALGALLDGIPESIVIGLSLLQGGVVSSVTVIAIFVSNLPEGLSSAAGMKAAGRSARYVFGVWGGIALASGVAAVTGYVLFDTASPGTVAAVTAVAAGAILAMLVDTMIPEAFSVAHDYAGMIAVVGFLFAFWLSKMPA